MFPPRRGDLIAGLTVWAVLVPESLAYASIAGVSPVVGLYAAPPALVLYAILGSSKHLIVGPMSATAALSAAAVAPHFGLTPVLAVVTGVVALGAGLLRLGFLANFISEPVLKGFIVGLALTIIAGQLPKLFGVEKGDGDFFEQIWDLIGALGGTQAATLAIGVASLALVMGLRRFAPVVPGSLVAVAFGVLVVELADPSGVDIVGSIDSGLPAIGLPDASGSDYLNLAASAVGVALVGFAEGLGAAKTYAARHHYEIDANREMIGLGAANLGAGLASGMVVNGSLSKTAVNGGAGAQSQMSGIVVALLTVVTLLFLTGLFESLPEATLAAVVIAAVAAMLGVLIFDTLPGLFIGIATSLTLLLYRASRPNVAVLGRLPDGHWVDLARGDAATQDGVVVLRVEAGLFFANAEHVRQTVVGRSRADGVRTVVIDAETVPFVDVTAAEMLARLRDDLERDGIQLLVARDIGQVRDVLRRSGAEQEAVVFKTVEDAVSRAR